MSDKRNKLREKIFSSSKKEIETINMMGEDVEMHQPSIGEIADLEQKKDEPRRDQIVATIIRYCFVPGTNDRVFTVEDEESILALPATVLDAFNTAFAKLTNINLEDAEKNLERR